MLASDDDEPEEVFLVRFVAASGGAVFDADSPGRIIVSQQGMPFGMVGFAGEALDPRVFVEGTFNAEVYFPVSRTGGNLGNIQVGVRCGCTYVCMYCTYVYMSACG